MGASATGPSVEVSYTVFYSLRGDKITALRTYMPIDAPMGRFKTSEPAVA